MKITKVFKIKFDEPSPHWLCADNLAVALHGYCKKSGIQFHVEEVTDSNLIYDRDMKTNYRKALEIVEEIRNTTSSMNLEMTAAMLKPKMPNIDRQVEVIRDLLDQGLHIEVVDRPVFVVTHDKELVYNIDRYKRKDYSMFEDLDPEDSYQTFEMRSYKLSDETYDLPAVNDETKSIFIFCWWVVAEDATGSNHEMIRYAVSNKKLYAVRADKEV